MTLRLITLAIALALLGTRADASPHTAYVSRALSSVRALGVEGRAELDRALYDGARARCHLESGTPAAACLRDIARAHCATQDEPARCEAAADVIAANLRSTSAWVDDATRFRLVRGSTDYRAALNDELRRRYAPLAAELALDGAGSTAGATGGTNALADDDGAAIDAFCARRDRTVHVCAPGDTACVPSLPWSRCVAALIWFIGGGS